VNNLPIPHLAIVHPEPSPFPELPQALALLPAKVRKASNTTSIESFLLAATSAVILVADSPDDLTAMPPRIKAITDSPLLTVITFDLLDVAWPAIGIEDFFVGSSSDTELRARVRHLLTLHPESADLMRHGDLAINAATCEVSIAGRLVELTFKEYELLKFLAREPGRVHTRQSLLNKVWGYDYYGGDRTVDVHIRRLRSKLEDPGHTFIDTVRNIGYRFRKHV